MSDLPRPVQNRIQQLLGEDEHIVAGLAASMFYTPLVVTLGSVMALTDNRLLMYRYGVFRIGKSPVFEAARDGTVHIAASDLLGPGAGLVITVPDGDLRLSVWRVKHLLAYVPEANRILD